MAIADVDSLVTKGSASNRQAMHNGATVYTEDKIFPMIHEAFSTDLTSLNGDQDHLAMVKEYQVTPDGEVVEPQGLSGLHSQPRKNGLPERQRVAHRWHRSQASALQNPVIAEQIRLQDEASQRLRANFYAKGSLEIESKEVPCRHSRW